MSSVNGRRWDREGITVVELRGTPAEIGHAHGALLREEVRRAYFDLVESRVLPGIGMEMFGDDTAKIAEFSAWCHKKALAYKDRVGARYLAEMRALAEVAGLTFEQVLLAQVVLDVVELAGMTHSPQHFHSCTQVAFLPELTGGKTLLARNLDWPSFGLAHELGVLFHYIPADGLPFWGLGWAGTIGTLTAVNHERLSVTEESLTVSPDVSDQGMPTFLLHRSLAQFERTVQGGVDRLVRTPRTNGYHTLFASGKENDARTVLHSANHHALRRPNHGVCWGIEPNRAADLYEGGQWPDSVIPLTDDSSDFRYRRIEQLMKEHTGDITPQDLMRWMADDIDPDTKQAGTDLHCLSNETTIQSLVADLTTGDFWVAMGQVPAPAGGYVKFNVDEKE